ncbi:LysM peptidoglycan-binding domain-containing protein [Anaerocolumna aminovalerica]|uniref:LysM peptidoglycan-binding domain-containing protein n=1 Tax=Anaerocolumna aminovalerica TaxID=1527 RepID=UPI001C0EB05B|nr:LysM peptidoglycan-binding domain-containing protein [Anaerocolumna aminovalerica]MBU5331411.1 LysM peptidoglycan-binding domain-containing protein [Anaerocolumna aminovalerica]
MEIWLKQGKEELRLPVLPSSYELSYSQNNTEVNITNFGIVNLIGNRSLATAELESFFPSKNYNFVQYKGFPKPNACVELIKKWMQAPVRYIVTGTKINILMTIEEFTYSEQDGTGDIYYALSLKEYRVPKATPQKKQPDKTSKKINKATTARETKKVSSTTYTVKPGDSLSVIAKRLTGDANNWMAIYNQNKTVIGGNPNKIKPGQKLVIKV